MLRENYKDIPKGDFMFELDITNTVSNYEFTGMMPTPPKNDVEAENYKEVLNYSPETIDTFQQKKER